MNISKFGRHLGIGKNFFGEMPSPRLTLDVGRLATVPASGGEGGNRQGSYIGTVDIDPPVGGFAPGDALAYAPATVAHQSVTAVAGPADPSNLFAAGHYRIGLMIHPPTANGGALVVQLLPYINGTFRPWAGGNAFPEWFGKTLSSAVDAGWWYSSEVYCPDPWLLRVYAYAAMADGNLAWVHFNICPLHILDEHSSQV